MTSGGKLLVVVLMLAGAAFLALGVGGIIFASSLSDEYHCSPEGYGIIFDAGSSHTSMAVYQWLEETTNGTGVVSQLVRISECTEEGIATYADDVVGIVPGLETCLNVAERTVPAFGHDGTPVYLGATAGMRMLTQTDPAKSEALMATVHDTLAASPFAFVSHKQATILTMDTEGISGWISANYLAANLGVKPAMGDAVDELAPRNRPIPVRPTYGALDLGGASLEITFVPAEPSRVPLKNRKELRLYGTTHTIFKQGFSCYGADEARRRLEAKLIENSGFADVTANPCSPVGYTYSLTGADLWKPPCSFRPTVTPNDLTDEDLFTLNGSSNATECYRLVKTLFDFRAACLTPPCSFNGAHTPLPHGSFKAFSGFAYTTLGIGLSSTPTIQELNNASESYCSKSYADLAGLPQKEKFKVRYCFQSTYVRAILLDAFKFDKTTWNIEFTLAINGANLDWSVGFMIDATNRIPEEESCVGLSPVSLRGLLAMFIVIIFIALVLMIVGTRICYVDQSLKRKHKSNSDNNNPSI